MIGAITAPLIIPPCNECAGQGSFVTSDCTEVRCEPCSGTGEGIPICSACNAPPQLVNGLESCQCDPSQEIEWAMEFTDWLAAA